VIGKLGMIRRAQVSFHECCEKYGRKEDEKKKKKKKKRKGKSLSKLVAEIMG
jgi:hypothetical protein